MEFTAMVFTYSRTSMSPSSLEQLASRFAEMATQRAAGLPVSAASYEELMLTCVRSGHGLAAYRLMEEAAAEGIRYGSFSQTARELLEDKLPPEAETLMTGPDAETLDLDLDATGSGKSGDEILQMDDPPRLWCASPRLVRSFDCSEGGGELSAAWEAVAAGDGPVLLRGVGSGWSALRVWRLPHLSQSVRRAMVRVAPSTAVTFCRESHPAVRAGEVAAPSRTVIMDVAEFSDRLHAGRRGRTPLLYGEDERVYLQALASPALMGEIDLCFLPEPVRDENEGRACGRLWASAPGTVSPLHFDETDSYLCQVCGVKRMLLWPASALPLLKPYPDDHPLARRLRVRIDGEAPPEDLSAGDVEALSSPYEAVLQPGDVLWFPARWPHHTEAVPPDPGTEVVPSISLGFRSDGILLL